jgi:hypothetical protein
VTRLVKSTRGEIEMDKRFDALVREGMRGVRLARGHAVAACAILLLLVTAAGALAEEPQRTAPSRKKVQEVDLHSLEIKGRLDAPSSLFLLEKGASTMSGWSLEGLLGTAWIVPIEKEILDRQMITGVVDGGHPRDGGDE